MVLRFTQKGPKLTDTELAGVERELGVSLPDAYRDFLLEQNGGVPNPNSLSIKGCDELSLQWFYSIRPKQRERDLIAMTLHFREELWLPKQFLPIAMLDNDDLLLVTVSGKTPGRVALWTAVEEGFERDRVQIVHRSFNDLVVALVTPKAATDDARKRLFTQLEQAIYEDDLTRARTIAERIDLSRVPRGREHPIFAAIATKQVDAVRWLVEMRSDLKCRSLDGRTPLESARSEREIAAFTYDQALKGNRYVSKKQAERELKALDAIVKALESA